MANTYTLLETITVGAAGASSVTFNSIPQTGYTDLVMKASVRCSDNVDYGTMTINGSSANFSSKKVYGDGSSALSSSRTDNYVIGFFDQSAATANTFSNIEAYFSNYTSSNYKSFQLDGVTENNSASGAIANMAAYLWSNTAAISSLSFTPASGKFAQYSTFSLYGVSALGVTPTKAPKATGGSIIQTDGTYWYHAFLSSGTFTPATALSCDVLVVAGGGGGGGGWSSGGSGSGAGAGGYRTGTFSLSASANTVTVGAGGTGGSGGGLSAQGTQGSDSVFSTITSSGGGKGAGQDDDGFAGGSGSGGGGYGGVTKKIGGISSPVTSPVQGYKGGDGITGFVSAACGGGGAGGAGGTTYGSPENGGVGGVGRNTESSWLSVTGLGISGYLAAGGKGGGVVTTGNGVAGPANTGNGGAGNYGNTAGGAGGSGLVIIRYLA